MKLLIIFTILTIVNVVMSTIKSLLTVNGGKWLASISSAIYYGYYNIVLIYTVADFPMWQKVAVTAACNVVGVFLVKWCEERAEKEKLWKVETTVRTHEATKLIQEASEKDLSFNYVSVNKYTIFNFYCATKEESTAVKEVLKKYQTAKYFVSESKNL